MAAPSPAPSQSPTPSPTQPPTQPPTPPQTFGTGLTTRGRCLLAAGVAAAACAVLLDERDLLRVAAFVVVLPLLAALLGRRARVSLTAVRALHPPRLPAGGKAEVSLRVASRGRVPATGLLLEDAVPYAAGARPRFVVDWLTRTTTVELRYPLHPTLRGAYAIGPLSARVADPFGMAEFTRQLGEPSRLLVVPKTAQLTGLPPGHGQGTGQDGSIRTRSGQGDQDVVVRQYRHGDDLRKVHWRSTAHRDELMVRLEDRPWHSGTTVLLDHRAGAHRGHGPGASLEWAVSFAASVCLHLYGQRQTVRLVTVDGTVLAGDTGAAMPADSMLDALATLTADRRRELVPTGAGGQEMIAVLGELAPDEIDALVTARPTALAVLLDVTAWTPGEAAPRTDVAESARLLRAVGWGVVVAGPGDGLAAVWQRLCQVRPVTGVAR